MAPIRIFIAIDIPDQARTELASAIHTLRGLGLNDVRWVRPEGIHLTLKFLGDIDPGLVQPILKALEESGQGSAALDLGLAGLGVFPNFRNPRVVWVGLQGDLEVLKGLQSSIESNVELLGFPRESRGFTPHLTVGRVRSRLSPSQIQRMEQALEKGVTLEPYNWRADEVHLIQSTLASGGAVYRKLGTVPLRG